MGKQKKGSDVPRRKRAGALRQFMSLKRRIEGGNGGRAAEEGRSRVFGFGLRTKRHRLSNLFY